jgi:hypothetical protein
VEGEVGDADEGGIVGLNVGERSVTWVIAETVTLANIGL